MTTDQASIRRLRTGVVPRWELERLSVGYAKPRECVFENVEIVRTGGQPKSLFVVGEWGSGKSHFLAYLRAAADRLGCASAYVSLNGRANAVHHPQRYYGALMENVTVRGEVGLRNILVSLLTDDRQRATIRTFANSHKARDLAQPLLALCSAYERGDGRHVYDEFPWTVLLGADLSWADYAYKREIAVTRLGSIAQFFRDIGLGGLVVAFDEMETLDQLINIRSRSAAYGILGRLCRIPSLWSVFGICH